MEYVPRITGKMRLVPCERYVQQAGGHLAPAFVREPCEALPTGAVAKRYGPFLWRRLASFCKGRLPAQFVPKQIVVVRTLPKKSAGKVVKSSLRNL